jgi:hypothetical protein
LCHERVLLFASEALQSDIAGRKFPAEHGEVAGSAAALARNMAQHFMHVATRDQFECRADHDAPPRGIFISMVMPLSPQI